jgi:hypothetical protein
MPEPTSRNCGIAANAAADVEATSNFDFTLAWVRLMHDSGNPLNSG